MAAFSSSSSFQQHFLTASYLQLPNSSSTINNSNNLLEEPNNIANFTPCFSQFSQLPPEIETNLDHSTNVSALTNNEPSVFSIHTNNMHSSSIVTADYKYGNNTSEQLTQKVTPMNTKKRKYKQGSLANSAQSKDMGEVKEKKQKKMKDGEEQSNIKSNEVKKKGEKKAKDQEPPTGYIHVRARRGQATDSHSLAERVRRERISEKMKLLQALVPGCDKVTGKALMLDEIINYVQSLQYQVEFLSLKLASVNPMSYDFGMDLESFMSTPNQNLSSLASPLASMHQSSSPTAVNNYPLLDNSANSILFQHALPQGNRQVLWEVDEQRQKMINQSGFSHNNLFSFQ